MSEEKLPSETLAQVVEPRPGRTLAERYGHLADFVRGSSGRFPNVPVRAPFGRGYRPNGAVINLLNARFGQAAAAAAKSAKTVDAAFEKAASYEMGQSGWSYLDELLDKFVQDRLSEAGVKTATTREKRAEHRNAFLGASARAKLKDGRLVHDAFDELVSSFVYEDTGGAEDEPTAASTPKAKAKATATLFADEDEESEAAE